MTALSYGVNRDNGDAKFTRQRWIGGVPFSAIATPVSALDLTRLLFRQLMRWVCDAFPGAKAVFSSAIAHVVGVCAKPQVFWIYATRYIAAMQNKQPLGYRAVGYGPGVAMCEPRSILTSEYAITKPLCRAGIQPASLCFQHARPKRLLCMRRPSDRRLHAHHRNSNTVGFNYALLGNH